MNWLYSHLLCVHWMNGYNGKYIYTQSLSKFSHCHEDKLRKCFPSSVPWVNNAPQINMKLRFSILTICWYSLSFSISACKHQGKLLLNSFADSKNVIIKKIESYQEWFYLPNGNRYNQYTKWYLANKMCQRNKQKNYVKLVINSIIISFIKLQVNTLIYKAGVAIACLFILWNWTFLSMGFLFHDNSCWWICFVFIFDLAKWHAHLNHPQIINNNQLTNNEHTISKRKHYCFSFQSINIIWPILMSMKP